MLGLGLHVRIPNVLRHVHGPTRLRLERAFQHGMQRNRLRLRSPYRHHQLREPARVHLERAHLGELCGNVLCLRQPLRHNHLRCPGRLFLGFGESTMFGDPHRVQHQHQQHHLSQRQRLFLVDLGDLRRNPDGL